MAVTKVPAGVESETEYELSVADDAELARRIEAADRDGAWVPAEVVLDALARHRAASPS